MTQKTKKVLNIVGNVVAGIIFVLILTVNIIASSSKGYTALFGYTNVSVLSDSMDGNEPDSFKRGDLLKVKILSDEEKDNLKVGDIITFYDLDNQNQVIINSHRIVVVNEASHTFRTKGDNPNITDMDARVRDKEDIIGIVVSHTDGLGYVSEWFRSSTGFFVCVVLPSLLVVVYCIYMLVKVIMERNKEKDSDKEEEIKQRLLEELRQSGQLPPAPESVDGANPPAEAAQPTDPPAPEAENK